MKLAVAIADTKAGASAFVVWRGFEESMRKAAELGYQGVELALRSRADVDTAKLRALLRRYGLAVSCISTGQVFADLGLYLTDQDSERRAEAVGVITGLVELAGEFGGMVNLGRARGFVAEGQTEEQTAGVFIDSLGKILPVAERCGVAVVIEPVNRYEINFINSVASCGALLEQIPSPAVGIMPDVFHMNIEDAQIGQALVEHAAKIKYVHLADSNRQAPGWGHLDFDEVFDALKTGGYDGWVSIEILPLPEPDAAARQAAAYILPRVAAYNTSVKR